MNVDKEIIKSITLPDFKNYSEGEKIRRQNETPREDKENKENEDELAEFLGNGLSNIWTTRCFSDDRIRFYHLRFLYLILFMNKGL